MKQQLISIKYNKKLLLAMFNSKLQQQKDYESFTCSVCIKKSEKS